MQEECGGESFGARCRRLREEQGLKQTEVGSLLNLTSQAISQYERGMRRPDYEILDRLARLYGVSLRYLMTGRTENPPDELGEDCSDLPPEARSEIRSFIRYVRGKYDAKP